MWKGSFSRLKGIFSLRFACVCCCYHGCFFFVLVLVAVVLSLFVLLSFFSCFSCVLATVGGNCCGPEATNQH